MFINTGSTRLSEDVLLSLENQKAPKDDIYIETDVFIAGSGPIAATYASVIIEDHGTAKVFMAEIGSQESRVIGEHHKNAIKYQKDIDAFVNVIKGALQPISISPSDAFLPTLGGSGWAPAMNEVLVFEGHNPNQNAQNNLKAAAVTRAVGGMATHWTCNCPVPDAEERCNNPIEDLGKLLEDAKILLNVHSDQYDHSIRHTVVKETLEKAYPKRGITSLPLAVQRNRENPDYVTWTGMNTILGKAVESPRFTLSTEMRVTKLTGDFDISRVELAELLDLKNKQKIFVKAKCFIIACGAIGTPQILFNSGINIKLPALGHYLAEQSLAFCQIVLKRSIVDAIREDSRFKGRVEDHKKSHSKDPLPIPFPDPEPQVMIPYKHDFPWHVQIHRDAFSYGDVGPKADPRVVVDLRFFGKQDIVESNCVKFGELKAPMQWKAGVTDIYGMPQATFEVVRSKDDAERDQRMMGDMTEVANALGSFLPGSAPQFMEPGLALHITGTTRIGTDPKKSVADPNSKVHGFKNLWVGGNGCIPDSTACNPTRTSMAIAIKGARDVVAKLKSGSY